MFEARKNETPFLHYLRLTARAASIVCLAIIFFFFVGEGIDFSQVTYRQWIGLMFFPLTVVIGLVLAWREEGLGGAISIVGILGFYLVYGWLLNGSLRQGWAFLPFLVPGILFVLYRVMPGIDLSVNRPSTSS